MGKDWLDKILKWIDYNRYLVISLVLFAILTGAIIGAVGCSSTIPGLIADPSTGVTAKVDRDEFANQVILVEKDFAVQRIQLDASVASFNEEVTAFNAKVEAGYADLDRQDAFRQEIVNTVSLVAASAAEGTLNPISLIPIGIGILGGALGLGAGLDNRRKDQVIRDLKMERSTTA